MPVLAIGLFCLVLAPFTGFIFGEDGDKTPPPPPAPPAEIVLPGSVNDLKVEQ